jgi:TM2 domain-containing membrane protein YozV
MSLATCPECSHQVSKTAAACPSCGAHLRSNTNNGLAAVLSLLIPGLGQLYQGRVLTGLILFVLTLSTLMILVGFLFWILAILDCFSYRPKSRAR